MAAADLFGRRHRFFAVQCGRTGLFRNAAPPPVGTAPGGRRAVPHAAL